MDYFGIKSVKDLPQLKDLHVEQNEIGQPSDENSMQELVLETSSDDVLSVPSANDESLEEIRNEDDENVLIDTEESTFQTEFVADDVMEIPDRRTIFIENELKNEVEEEASENEENEDLN